MYRVLGAACVAGFICIIFTPALIRFLRRMEYGQVVREDGPQAHFVKKGTPTMGGILIILGPVIAYCIFSKFTPEGLIVLGTMVACGLLGFADDFIQIRKKRSLGLKGRYKILGQIVIALGFTLLATRLASPGHPKLPMKLSFLGGTGLSLGLFFFAWVFIMIIAASNSVNLTDGLDDVQAPHLGPPEVLSFHRQPCSRHRHNLRGGAGRLRRLSLVERCAGEDLHG
jgi:phospho-N-acetylmuramoyl-pentapeptide-transferase